MRALTAALLLCVAACGFDPSTPELGLGGASSDGAEVRVDAALAEPGPDAASVAPPDAVAVAPSPDAAAPASPPDAPPPGYCEGDRDCGRDRSCKHHRCED